MCGCKWQFLLFIEELQTQTSKRRILVDYKLLSFGQSDKDKRSFWNIAEFKMWMPRNIWKALKFEAGVRKDSDLNKK